MVILGVWDGHDAGAALLVDGVLAAAVNEERITRRKLEVRFPARSIEECLRIGGLPPGRVDLAAASTSDVAKTIGRWFPGTKERYYDIRRRKVAPAPLTRATKSVKYTLTEWRSSVLTAALSRRVLVRDLAHCGIRAPLRLYDHHEAHAAAAALGSGMSSCAVVTVDGVGDGASATVNTFDGEHLTRLATTPARHSLGVFFEHVTNLLNMRELEDEGKVMALADYAAPVPDAQNPLLGLVATEGLEFRTAAGGRGMHGRLRALHWFYPNEQFAFMAQRVVEQRLVELARETILRTGLTRLALSGGVASNVKATRKVRLLPEIEDLYVFPHMGDGGLALGAACRAAMEEGERPDLALEDLGLGVAFSDDDFERALRAAAVAFCRPADVVDRVADLIAAGRIVLWFQGREEYGPRALGHRSVLARPDRADLRDRVNLLLKRRVWYQPFCPSLLEGDARAAFDDWKGRPGRHMTMAYRVAPAFRPVLAGVTSVDGTCRPQIVREDAEGPFAALLRAVRARLGFSAVLNTSFNIHGAPLVHTPAEAIDVFRDGRADALVLGPCVAMLSA
jgi:carbamoyltransferase